VGANRIELIGRLLADPELRITPAGTPVLRILVECDDAARKLALGVVMAGESCRAACAGLRRGRVVEVSGTLRLSASRETASAGVEVMADRIEARG
jgi:primosomal replication protein N